MFVGGVEQPNTVSSTLVFPKPLPLPKHCETIYNTLGFGLLFSQSRLSCFSALPLVTHAQLFSRQQRIIFARADLGCVPLCKAPAAVTQGASTFSVSAQAHQPLINQADWKCFLETYLKTSASQRIPCGEIPFLYLIQPSFPIMNFLEYFWRKTRFTEQLPGPLQMSLPQIQTKLNLFFAYKSK